MGRSELTWPKKRRQQDQNRLGWRNMPVNDNHHQNRKSTIPPMDCDRLLAQFHRIVEAVRSEDRPLSCWAEVLEITSQRSNEALAGLDIVSDIISLTEQTDRLLRAAPLPTGVTFLWFGLCDSAIGDREIEGYYVSGWSGTNPDEDRSLAYFPESRWLTSSVLNSIKDALRRVEKAALHTGKERPEDYHVLDYAVMFGAAAILTKFAIQPLNAQKIPVYVGFDSGDWALVNTPASTTNRVWPIVPMKRIDASSVDLS